MKYIYILSSLDTKAEETAFLREQIQQHGFEVKIIDVGYGGKPRLQPDISVEEAACASGTPIYEFHEMQKQRDRDALSRTVRTGTAIILKNLINENCVAGVMTLGGTSAAALAAAVMNELPYTIPQLIFTTAASLPSSYQFFGASGVTVMHSLTEVGGLNHILRKQLARAASAICGMASERAEETASEKPCIALTTNGWCERTAERLLEKLGDSYELIRFHAIGQPEVVMERLIEAGAFEAVIDLVPSSITNAKFNGTRISWDRRLTVAGERGVPQIVSLDLVNVISRMRTESPEQKTELEKRKHYFIDNLRILLWLTREELLDLADEYADRLNVAVGPTLLLIPRKGWVSIERDGVDFYDPETEAEFVCKLRGKLKPEIMVMEVDANIDDPAFADAITENLEKFMRKQENKT